MHVLRYLNGVAEFTNHTWEKNEGIIIRNENNKRKYQQANIDKIPEKEWELLKVNI